MDSRMDYKISVDALTFYYGEESAIKNISLTVKIGRAHV